ncbi:MAG: imidazoleglycerol-phosphate dehydratase HisB [Firmicutes bacterium]|jgi:imidazoleglycerol-phosphate dehydratase|nr:imidazoleglycerol-phosphate dehydratase HisB [Bacillota bacterium]
MDRRDLAEAAFAKPPHARSGGAEARAARGARVDRETSETRVGVDLDLEGTGNGVISTGCGFLDHMLVLARSHGMFDLSVSASGDTNVDFHHLAEDVGICLGTAVDRALGDRRGIARYAHVSIPMDEALAVVSLDASGRGFLVYNVPGLRERVGEMDTEVIEEFFAAFARSARVTLHVNLAYGHNTHHILEAVFKAFGRAVSQAASVDPRQTGVPSTKGVL